MQDMPWERLLVPNRLCRLAAKFNTPMKPRNGADNLADLHSSTAITDRDPRRPDASHHGILQAVNSAFSSTPQSSHLPHFPVISSISLTMCTPKCISKWLPWLQLSNQVSRQRLLITIKGQQQPKLLLP